MKNSDRQNRLQRTFVPDSKVILTLPPIGGKILRGFLALTGTLVVAGGTINGTVVGEGGPINLISRIIIRGNPGDGRYPGGELVDMTPRSLLRWAQTRDGGKFIGDLGGQTLGAGANGSYNVNLQIPFYFADPRHVRPIETALNADPNAYEMLQVEVQTADLAACFSGNNANVTYSGLQLQWIDDRENVAGDTFVQYFDDHIFQIPADNDRAIDEAFPKDYLLEDMLILGEQGTAETLADTLLNKVKIQGDTLEYDKWSADIKSEQLWKRFIDPSQNAAGIYYIDFCDGYLTGAVNAALLQMRLDVNNVSGANLDQLRIATRRYVAPTGYVPIGATSAKKS